MDVKQLAERVNGLLVTVCSAQQIIMVAGFTLFQAGVVQPKNVTSVLIKSLFDLTLSCLTWWLIGKRGMGFIPVVLVCCLLAKHACTGM